MPKSIWELENEVRRQLQSGVDFGGRLLGVSGLDEADVIKWVKLKGEAHKRLVVVYIRGVVMVTVHAFVRGDDAVEITSVSLDNLCGGGGNYG